MLNNTLLKRVVPGRRSMGGRDGGAGMVQMATMLAATVLMVTATVRAEPELIRAKSDGSEWILRVEQVDRQEADTELTNALNVVNQRFKRQRDPIKREMLKRRKEQISQEIDRATGYVLRGFTRSEWAGDEPGRLINLVLYVGACWRYQVEDLKAGDLVRARRGPWRGTVTNGGIGYFRAESLARLSSNRSHHRRAGEPAPWSSRPIDPTLTRLARFRVQFGSEPLLGQEQDGSPAWLHTFKLGHEAEFDIESSRMQVLAYTLDGEPVGPFDVHYRRAVADEDGEINFGIAMPAHQQLDAYEFEVRVRELRVTPPKPNLAAAETHVQPTTVTPKSDIWLQN